MLKKRIIAVLLFRDGVLCRTKNFVSDYFYTKEHINTSDCDELCCIRVSGSWGNFFDAVNHVGEAAMLPCMVGGGISSLEEARDCFRYTVADKVCVEGCFRGLAEGLCSTLGRQSLVCGVTEGRSDFDWSLLPFVGEFFIQSVERDGSLRGYPLDFAAPYIDSGVPCILGSGCAGWMSMLAGFEAGADACSTANIHHFTPVGMKAIKRQLVQRGVSLRETLQGMSDAGHPSEGAVYGRSL